MWPWDDKMPTFKALSYGDKWRVSRSLARGEAPGEPRMAAAAVELAESYQRQNGAITVLMRWLPVLMIVGVGYVSISTAVEGDGLMLIYFALIVLLGIVYLTFSPTTRPKKMAQGLEASRRVVASRG